MKRASALPIPAPKRKKTTGFVSAAPRQLVPPINTSVVAQKAQKREYVGVFTGDRAGTWFGLIQYREIPTGGLREKRTGECYSQDEAVLLVKALYKKLLESGCHVGRTDYGSVIGGTTGQINSLSLRLRKQKKQRAIDSSSASAQAARAKRTSADDTPERRSKRPRKQPVRYRQKYMQAETMVSDEDSDDGTSPSSKKKRTGYRGVTWDAEKQKWACKVFKFKNISRSYFPTAKKAAKAYDKTLLKLLGKTAKLNFPKKSLDAVSASEVHQNEALDELSCMICRKLDDEGFLLCENMEAGDHGGHYFCFGLSKVPEDDWFCPLHAKTGEPCVAHQERAKMRTISLPPPTPPPAVKVVDEILNVRDTECLVKWKGFGFASATWEPIGRFKKHPAMERYISRCRSSWGKDPSTTVVVQSNAYQRPYTAPSPPALSCRPLQQQFRRQYQSNPLSAPIRSNVHVPRYSARAVTQNLGGIPRREPVGRNLSQPSRGPTVSSGTLTSPPTHRNAAAPPLLENISHQQLADHVNSITQYKRPPTSSAILNRRSGIRWEVRNGNIPKTMRVPVDFNSLSNIRQSCNGDLKMPPLEADTPLVDQFKPAVFEPSESNSKRLNVEPNNVEEWGTGLDYGRAISLWEITKVKLGAQFHRLGVRPGWILMQVDNIPLLENNRGKVEQVLKSGRACSILFRTDLANGPLEEPSIEVGDKVFLKDTVRLRRTLENPVLDPRGTVTQIWMKPNRYEYRVLLSDNNKRDQVENLLVKVYEDEQMKQFESLVLQHKNNLARTTKNYSDISHQIKELQNRQKLLVEEMNSQQKQLEKAQGQLLIYGVQKGESEARKEREEARKRQQKILQEKIAAEARKQEEDVGRTLLEETDGCGFTEASNCGGAEEKTVMTSSTADTSGFDLLAD